MRWIAIGLAAVVAAAVLGAFLMPRHATVTRSTDIAADAAAVFPLVADLRRFNDWSPWLDRDPDASYLFTGPTDGVGQTLRWESDEPDIGSGSLTVERLDLDREVAIAADLGDRGTAATWFTLDPAASGTTVTWGFSTDLGFNPVGRYFGPAYAERVAADYERGLAKLKTIAEAPPPEPEED